MTKGDDSKREKLERVLAEMGTVSGQESGNAVVNVAALIKLHKEIEEAMGEPVQPGDYFELLTARVMRGGVIVLTDESTTGQAIEVDFQKKIRF